MSVNILQVSIGHKVYLTKYFRKAYKALGIEGKIIGTDIDPYTPGIYATDKHYIAPRRNDPSFIPKIIDICKKEKINLLMPTSDEDVEFFAQHRKSFEGLGVKVLAPSYEIAAICSDKMKFYEKLTELGIDTPKIWPEKSSGISYPCIVKPRKGKGSIGVRTAQSAEELGDLEGMIIQEKLEGTEYTIDYFADFDSNPICIVPRIRMVVREGESKVAITKKDDAIIELCKKLGIGLGFIGQNTIQCFKTLDGRISIVENNMRFGGGSPLGMESGCKSPEYLLRLMQGEKLQPDFDFQDGLIMIRYSENIFLPHAQITDIRSRRYTL